MSSLDKRTWARLGSAVAGVIAGLIPSAHAQEWVFGTGPAWVSRERKINDIEGGFSGILDDRDFFGSAVASLGDLDGDGVIELAVGAMLDDDGGPRDRGAVWVLFLNTDGTVKSHQKISETEGGFRGGLDISDRFGGSLALLGDLDGDGVVDLAVGALSDDDGGTDHGAVWVLFLRGAPCDPCDMNCDGDVNAFDIEPFLMLLFDPNPKPCNTCTGDANGDGAVNAFDIEPFLNCLFGP